MNLLKFFVRKIMTLLGLKKYLFVKKCYSQDGEDVLLQAFFADMGGYKGFYIDIGAHHPMRFSNTQLFYEEGWSGINIDAMPGSMKEFNKIRKRDINIEAGISDENGELEYYSFEEPALNTFVKSLAQKYIDNNYKLKETIKIKSFPINDILGKYLSEGQVIDFISIDIEGLDLKVIKSLNYEKFSPNFIVVEDDEILEKDIMDYNQSKIFSFLKEKGYCIVAKTLRTTIYRKNRID